MTVDMGIVSTAVHFPDGYLTSADIAEASGFPERVVVEKLGITRKYVAGPDDHPNAMAVLAAREAIEKAEIDPAEIDVVLCTTEEFKEYNLWTAGIDLAYEVGAVNAWGMDMHMRCATSIAALTTAKGLLAQDPDIDTILIGGGYVVSRFIDFSNPRTSFLWNIGAGAGAMVVRRDHPRNRVLGTHLISDGSMSRHVLVPASGTVEHPTPEAIAAGRFFFDLLEPNAMKARLGEVSMDNWMRCVDEALRKSGHKVDGTSYSRADLDYLNMLLVKPSAHAELLRLLGLRADQSVYLGDIGHIGEQDSIISMVEGERAGRLKDGDLMAILGAGIGYVWGAAIVQWGEAP
jgi:3-oxoacyl-[acyl-carrier-protein] synthase-3